jgi:hypothetical protein
MGTNQFGLAVYGATPAEVVAALTGWLRQRGFERQAGPPPRRLYEDRERGARVYAAERAAVVLFSDLGELERLCFELRKSERPTLLSYMHDSSMMGYELWLGHRAASAWSNEPDDPDLPGPDDVAALASATGSDASTLTRLRGRRAVFLEAVSGPLYQALGAAPLAGTWDDPFEAPHEALWFREEGWDPWAGFDLYAQRFETAPPGPEAPPPRPGGSSWLTWLVWAIFAPIGAALRLYSWLTGRPALPGAAMPWTVEGRTLRHAAFGVSCELPEGVRSVDWPLLQDVDVFVVDVGGALLMMRESSPEELKQRRVFGGHGSDVAETRDPVAGHPARRLRATQPGGGWALQVWVHPPGRLFLLQASGQGPMSDAVRGHIDGVLGGLRLETPEA